VPSSSVLCPHCSYEISSYTELVEVLESGGHCLLCGGIVAEEPLRSALDAFTDEEILAAGVQRAEDEADLAEEENTLEGDPDFGDEGEEEEDPLF